MNFLFPHSQSICVFSQNTVFRQSVTPPSNRYYIVNEISKPVETVSAMKKGATNAAPTNLQLLSPGFHIPGNSNYAAAGISGVRRISSDRPALTR